MIQEFQNFFSEDDLFRNLSYTEKLSTEPVQCLLKFKSPMILAGMPYFVGAFKFLGVNPEIDVLEYEGKKFDERSKPCSFQLPFKQAILGERIALNLLTRAASISTFTGYFVERARDFNIAILDTRKTTPGLRSLEKYAVLVGGGLNHRLGQTDAWMIKDNHKKFYGSIQKSLEFFQSLGGFYTPIIVEVSDLSEISEAQELGIKHLLLDNFTPDMVKNALDLKRDGVTFEVSGGITPENFNNYLIRGVDAISIGALTQFAPRVDISLKMEKVK
jgi:nicotinate-nucleotide pyrophosphorylase (carboxylating)